MSVSVTCRACGAKARGPDQLAGKTVKCPKCRSPIAVPSGADLENAMIRASPIKLGPLPIPEVLDDVEVVDAPARAGGVRLCDFCREEIRIDARKCKHCGEVLDPVLRASEEAKRAAERASHFVSPVHVNVEAAERENEGSSPLGGISVVFGGLALLIAMLPCAGVFSIPVAGIGLIFAVLGMLEGITRDGNGPAWALAGAFLCGIALAMGFMWYNFNEDFSRSLREAQKLISR